MPHVQRRRRAASSPRRSSAPSRRRPAATPSRPAQSELDRALTQSINAPVPEATSFAELGVPSELVAALTRGGVNAPFAIQTRTLPDALAGRDVLGRAQTGSGKTLAFGIPMLTRLAGARSEPKSPRGLVLVPTRELARQVADALTPLAQALRLKVVTVYGGAPIGRQIDQLKRGADVVVATPGRLIDHLDRRTCALDAVEISVLDEADHMADLGFLPAVTRLLDATPEGQRLLFSATLDRGVERLVRSYLHEPAMHAIAAVEATIDTMEHRVFVMPLEDKVAIAAEIAARPGRTLIFVRTKRGADRLARKLTGQGVAAAAIHGNLNQNQRQRALAGFTAGHPRVLVATDVAARGIHVDDVDLVMHFDPPNDHKDYLHRSGRTARAGARGTVVALAQPDQVRDVAKLHQLAGVTPISNQVHVGHDAVRAVATSGVPVPVAEAPAQPQPQPARPRNRAHRGQRPAARHQRSRSRA